jgi:hypothetical protein
MSKQRPPESLFYCGNLSRQNRDSVESSSFYPFYRQLSALLYPAHPIPGGATPNRAMFP